MTDPARLQRALDEHEIRDLAQRYAIAVSFADLDSLADLFDPEVDNGKFGIGRDGVRAYYVDFFAGDPRHPFMQVGTHQVDLIDDETATGVCLTRSWSGTPAAGWSDIMVVYFDLYRKRDNRWGFVHRRATIHDVAPAAPHADVSLRRSPARGAVPRSIDYWPRWQERKAAGELFR